MAVSILVLKELPEERTLFMNFPAGSETGICVSMNGKQEDLLHAHVLVVADVLRLVSDESVKMRYSWNFQEKL